MKTFRELSCMTSSRRLRVSLLGLPKEMESDAPKILFGERGVKEEIASIAFIRCLKFPAPIDHFH